MDRALSLPSLRDDLRLLGTGAERDGSPGWTIFDPARNRFFRIGWLEFEPATLALIGIAGLIGLALAARQWDAFTASLAAAFTPAGVFGFLCALAIAKSLHELGHAYVATRAGVRVAHMGVAFVVMWPMLYTDTGETWKLADARTRFAIASAGLVTELAIAALATLGWSLTADGALRDALFFLATTSWLRFAGCAQSRRTRPHLGRNPGPAFGARPRGRSRSSPSSQGRWRVIAGTGHHDRFHAGDPPADQTAHRPAWRRDRDPRRSCRPRPENRAVPGAHRTRPGPGVTGHCHRHGGDPRPPPQPQRPGAARCGVGADPREWFVEGSRLLSVIEPVGCWHVSRPPQVTAVQKKPRWRATFPGQLTDQRRRPRANEKPTMPRPTVNSAIVAGSGTG